MTAHPFQVEFSNPHWIEENSTSDLCAHGSVAIIVESQIIKNENDLCITAGALYLLRSLFKNIIIQECGFEEELQLIPCCGHAWLAQENCVLIMSGCPIGIGWNVTHKNNKVILDGLATITTTNLDLPIRIHWYEYAKTVVKAVELVLLFHQSEPPREFSDDEDRAGHDAFWTEFNRLLALARERMSQ